MNRRERGANMLPEMPMMVDDWLGSQSIILMGRAAEGCYLRLLLYQWRDGSIPEDIGSLAILCMMPREEMNAIWDKLANEFPICEDDPTRRANRRGVLIRATAEDKLRARSEACRAAVEAREAKRRQSNTAPAPFDVVDGGASDDPEVIERSSNDDPGDDHSIIHPLPLPLPVIEHNLNAQDAPCSDMDAALAKRTKAAPDLLAFLPEEFHTEEFKEAWSDLCQHRAELRVKAYGATGLRQLAGKLVRYGWDAESASELIGITISTNWQGLPHDKLARGPDPKLIPGNQSSQNAPRPSRTSNYRPVPESSAEVRERLKQERASRRGIDTVEVSDVSA